MKTMIVALGIAVLLGGCTFNITFNITGVAPARPGSGSLKPEEGGLHVYPPELRAGDIVTDEHGGEWELISPVTRVVGTLDFVATVRRIDSPAETREARWRANERVKIRRSVKEGEAPSKS